MSKQKVNITGLSKDATKIISESKESETHLRKNHLKDRYIGISVSDSEEYKQLGFSSVHQKDITIELTRYLLVNGAHLVYGGDLRKDGYTEAFSELSFQYREKEEHDKKHYTNFFGWPIYNLLKNSDEAIFKKNRVEIEKVQPPKDVPDELKQKFIDADTLENRKMWALSMSKMRNEMNEKTAARIFIGGALSKYKGFYPGIVEEGILAVRKNRPVYLIGAFGGATNLMIRAIKGESEKKLVEEVFQCNPALEDLYKYVDYRSLVNNFYEVFHEFRKLGSSGLGDLNGLTKAENELLFDTVHFHEMIYYTLVGLKKKL